MTETEWRTWKSNQSAVVAQALRDVVDDGGPLCLVLVANPVVGDSRVIKTARSLNGAGYRCLLVGIQDGSFGLSQVDGVPLLRVPQRRELLRGSAPDKREQWIRDFSASVLLVIEQFDVSNVYSHDMWALLAGFIVVDRLRSRGQSVFWVHDIHEDCHGYDRVLDPATIVAAKELETMYFKSPDHIVTVNNSLADILKARHAYSRSISVVYNCPLTPASVPQKTLRQTLRLAQEIPLGVYAGRANQWRGLDIIITLLKSIDALHVAVVADEVQTYLSSLVAEATRASVKDRLHILPCVAHDEVSNFISDADFGLSLIKDYGNAQLALPTKVLEYLHAGLPVVVSDRPLQAAFVQRHGIGIVTQGDEADPLAEAVQMALHQKSALRRSITPDLLAQYSWESQFNCVVNVVQRRDPCLYKPPLVGPRVFIGPGSNAGQPGQLARALRADGCPATAVSVAPVNRYGYVADVTWHCTTFSGMAALTRWALEHFDVFHFHARPINWTFQKKALHAPVFVDLLAARALRKGTVFSFRGGEARVHEEFVRLSPYAWSDLDDYAKFLSDGEKRKLIQCISEIVDVVTVTDPELASYVPGARVLPRSIDCSDWQFVGAVRARRPLVVHAPSRETVKGTEFVTAAVERLKEAGLDFEFRLVQGLENSTARQVYETADIVIDQLRIGWYGVLAVEAMALGKTVICYIREDLVDFFEGGCPMLTATPHTIEDVLRNAIENYALRVEMGRRARGFCTRYHDHARVAAVARGLYEEAQRSPRTTIPFTFISIASRTGAALAKSDALVKQLTKEVATLKAAKTEATAAAKKTSRPNGAGTATTPASCAATAPGCRKGLFAPPLQKIPARIVRRLGLRSP